MQFLSKPRVAKQCLILHGKFDFCLDTFGLWELLWEAFVRGVVLQTRCLVPLKSL